MEHAPGYGVVLFFTKVQLKKACLLVFKFLNLQGFYN